MNNIAILDNPYSEGVIISTNGVGISSKAAKINDDKRAFEVTKKDRLVANWEKNKPAPAISDVVKAVSEPKDYSSVLLKAGITPVNYAKEANNNGAKKLRVNQIVNGKTSNIYNNSSKVDVPAIKEEKINDFVPQMPVQNEASTAPAINPVMEEKVVARGEANIPNSRSDIHGRHERTGEIPVDQIREAVRNNSVASNPSPISRVERNEVREDIKQEANGVDMDLYTSLMQNSNQEDVSKQLQGAKKEQKLKVEIANKKKMKEQHEKQELSATLNDLEAIKRDNLEKTSDLSSLRAEISRLEAQKRALEDNNIYDDYHSFGRAA